MRAVRALGSSIIKEEYWERWLQSKVLSGLLLLVSIHEQTPIITAPGSWPGIWPEFLYFQVLPVREHKGHSK